MFYELIIQNGTYNYQYDDKEKALAFAKNFTDAKISWELNCVIGLFKTAVAHKYFF